MGTSLQQTLSEMMVLMERVEERRLAEMEVNQSLEAPEEEEQVEEVEVPVNEPEPKNDPPSRAIVKYMPDYYESSDDEDTNRKVVPAPRLICSCSGDGSCLFCKKMRGCTCEGQGTCRLCELDEEKKEQKEESDDDIEIIDDDDEEDNSNQAELSTTELFLLGMTDPKRTPSPRQRVRGQGRMRGSGRGRQPPLRPPIPIRQASPQPQFNPRAMTHINQPSPRARGQIVRISRPRAPVHSIPQVRVNYGTQPRPSVPRPRILRPRLTQTRPRVPAQFHVQNEPSSHMVSRVTVRGQPRMAPRASPYHGQLIRGNQLRPQPRTQPRSQSVIRPPRPNVVSQIYHQQPAHQSQVYDTYQNYSQNLSAPDHENYASASTYYQQAEVYVEDVVSIDDDDDDIEEIVEENVLSKLPSGIHIQRI